MKNLNSTISLAIILFLFSICSMGQVKNISGANDYDINSFYLKYKGFEMSYNDSLKHANWVGWTLESSDIGTTQRQNDFHPDGQIKKLGFTVITPQDYANIGYDRGHLCNSQARTASVELNSETFSMANMIPQTPDLNRHTWESLEMDCENWAKQGEHLIIYAGGYGSQPSKISSKSIDVPLYCWKVIFGHGATPICVIFPNENGLPSTWKHKEFITTLEDLENKLHYKF